MPLYNSFWKTYYLSGKPPQVCIFKLSAVSQQMEVPRTHQDFQLPEITTKTCICEVASYKLHGRSQFQNSKKLYPPKLSILWPLSISKDTIYERILEVLWVDLALECCRIYMWNCYTIIQGVIIGVLFPESPCRTNLDFYDNV